MGPHVCCGCQNKPCVLLSKSLALQSSDQSHLLVVKLVSISDDEILARALTVAGKGNQTPPSLNIMSICFSIGESQAIHLQAQLDSGVQLCCQDPLFFFLFLYFQAALATVVDRMRSHRLLWYQLNILQTDRGLARLKYMAFLSN